MPFRQTHAASPRILEISANPGGIVGRRSNARAAAIAEYTVTTNPCWRRLFDSN